MSSEEQHLKNTAIGHLVIKTEPNGTDYTYADSKDFQLSLKALQGSIKQEPLDTVDIKQEIKVEAVNNQSEDFTAVKKFPKNETKGVKKKKKKKKRKQPFESRPYWSVKKVCTRNQNRASGICQQATSNPVINVEDTSDEDGKISFLHIINFPTSWNVMQIRSLIENLYGPVYKITMCFDVRSEFTGAVILQFPSLSKCRRAEIKLNGKKVEGKRLRVIADDDSDDNSERDSDLEHPVHREKRARLRRIRSKWRPDRDAWNEDPEGLYGLKLEYLGTLGIIPPIDKWVRVLNFKCSRAELRAALEVAGQTLVCEVVETRHEKFANVCYTHPLEAVQAISMLNGKYLFGEEIELFMDKPPSIDSPCTLPNGLSAVGPGLGTDGKPLKDLIRQFGRYARGYRSEINSTIFNILHERCVNGANIRPNPASNPQDIEANITPNPPSNPQDIGENISPNPPSNPQDIGENISPNPPSNLQDIGGSVNPNSPSNLQDIGSDIRPNRPPSLQDIEGNFRPHFSLSPQDVILSHSLPSSPQESHINGANSSPNQPRSNFMPQSGASPHILGTQVRPRFSPPNFAFGPRPFRPRFPGPRIEGPFRPCGPPPHGPQMAQGNVAVELSNLPPDSSFSEIWARMAKSGPVVSLEFTSAYCAVVRFPHISHAEACYLHNNYTSYKSNIVKARIL